MNKQIIIVLMMTGLSACMMPHSAKNKGEESDVEHRSSVQKTAETDQLNGIVSIMADELFKTRLSGEAFPVAVASFVNLETLDKTNWLGLQISENFIHELHRRGELVMDFKLTGVIQVTKSGETFHESGLAVSKIDAYFTCANRYHVSWRARHCRQCSFN